MKGILSTRFALLLLFILAGTASSLRANPDPSSYVLIKPVAVGNASDGTYFPLEDAFDGSVSWNSETLTPETTDGGVFAPSYFQRVGYIDFGPDFQNVHILETWTYYRSWSGGSHSGFAELWWDDDRDSINDGIVETKLNFNNGFDVPVLSEESWARDTLVANCGGVVPQARYLMLRSELAHTNRAIEFAMLGYYSPDPIPEGCVADTGPTLAISQNVIEENQELMTPIGDIALKETDESLEYAIELLDSEDSRRFRYLDGTLYSYFSFNYENRSRYTLTFLVIPSEGDPIERELEIRVGNLFDKWDRNGIADAEVAAKYPSVNEGDYLFLEPTHNDINKIYANSGIPKIEWPNKILIRGDRYLQVLMRLDALDGQDPDKKIVVTNFLGQVFANSIGMIGGSSWRLTGEYDAARQTGSPFYTGCKSEASPVDFAFSSGTYGIWASNEWKNSNGILTYISGEATGFEVDHMEISDGGFAGLMVKQDSGTVDMNDVRIHHLYIRDIGSEGIYLGSTQPDPQHMFHRLRIDHCYITRTGSEALQVGQLGADCIFENNVLWGAFDWRSPFQFWQDNVVQLGTRQGGVVFRNNIVMGGGEKFYNVSNKEREDITPNGRPIVFENNLNWGNRGPLGAYQFSVTDKVTNWEWKDNFWGYFDFQYNTVYTNSSPSKKIIRIATPDITVTTSGNRFQDLRENLTESLSSAVISSNDDQQAIIAAPQFRNLIAEADDYPLLNWNRWTATIGEAQDFSANNTNKGEFVLYKVGDVVQYHENGQVRFYRCIQEHSQQEPSNATSDYWELLSWSDGETRSFVPPDDARLVPGSFYHSLGIGLEDAAYDFRIHSTKMPSNSGLRIAISFQSEVGFVYKLESSLDLSDWETMPEAVAGDGERMSFENITTTTQAYYRIKALIQNSR